VADTTWQIVGIGDFNGDARADVLWRNAATGENYIYFMNGTAIASEGYIRAVADQHWQGRGRRRFRRRRQERHPLAQRRDRRELRLPE